MRLEYRLPPLGNSGVSLRDSSRGRSSFGAGERKTPAHIGYEIQLYHSDQTKYPSGSVYLFSPAKAGLQRANDWNVLEIESRPELIRVRLNGQLAAESPGDPARARKGPIGLQLHDRFSFVEFRDIRIRTR